MKTRQGLLLVAAALLAACSSGSHGSVLPSSQPPESGSAPTSSAPMGFSYDTSALQGAKIDAPASNLASISVDLIPAMRNAQGLVQYAKSVDDPASSNYRHFLTPQQIGDQFGAPASAYAASVKYFQSQGLSVATWPQRMLLHVSGPQAKMQAALHTTFSWYSNGKSVFLAPASTPAPPSVAGVVGAANIIMRTSQSTNYVKLTTSVGNGAQFGYSPQEVAAAFDYTGAYSAGYTGAGITTGVIGTAGFDPRDVSSYRSMFHVGGAGTATMVSATDANAPGNSALGFAPPPPVTSSCYGSPISPTATCNPEDVEAQLDTEQLSSLAPDANLRFYLAYNPNDGCGAINVDCPAGAGIPLQGLGEIDAEIQTAIADDKADVLSISFGGAEMLNVGAEFNAAGGGIEPLEFAALASEGVAIFVSSGDSGAQGCMQFNVPDPNALCVQYPSTDPNVVSVGGVNTPLNSAGRLVGAITGWGMHSGANGGSGGGLSAYFPLTSYQKGAAGITGQMRNVPDIALNADGLTGVAVLLYGGFPADTYVAGIGGTSVAAPEAAAMWALVLDACKKTSSCATASGPAPWRLGNPNAYFYKIYANQSTYASTFYDVLYGANNMYCEQTGPTPCPSPTDSGYDSGKGYDLVSGIGVPYARALIKAVVGK